MPKKLISVTGTGRFVVGGELRSQLEKAVAIDRGATAMIQVMQANTPVVTGRLYRGWHVGQKRWINNGATLMIQVFNNVFYAPFVNRRGKSKGYIDRGLKDGREVAMRAITRGSTWGEIAKYLWKKGTGG